MNISTGGDRDGSEDARQPIDINAGRRAFLAGMGLAAVGTAVMGGAVGLADEAAAQALTDADILNFALNLEYLEAEFYLRAVLGTGLNPNETTGSGRPGRVIGGRQVSFDTAIIRQYAVEIAMDERDHVRFLRAGLGSAKVARPQIDLRDSFTAAARAAGLVPPGGTFDPFANENNFLLGAFIFEDVGVTAYKGAARFLQNKDFLEAAAGILAVEAYHASEVRVLLLSRGFEVEAGRISKLRDTADGPGNRDQGIRIDGRANIVPADEHAIAFSRSPEQVLSIVYLGGDDRGGFFPRGLNGTIS